MTPADERWDEARRAWNLAVDQRPAAVAFPESADDVVAVVELAAAHGLRVAPQGAGHNAHPLELADTILLKTERMRAVRIDPEARRARVEAGALWMDVTAPAAEHGLAALAGSSPDVGVVGYTLGGGLSWLARRHGLAANQVHAVEVVTAGGELVRVDREHEPDLFWALRGGGGSFGAVTALEFSLFPIREVYAGAMFWPWERAGEVLHAWHDWIRTVPEEVTSVGRVLQFPDVPDIPAPVRGGKFAVVEAVYLGEEPEGAELVRPLAELEPGMSTFATIPAPALSHLHMDPPAPVPGAGDHLLLDEIPAEAIDALVEVAGPGSGSPLLSVELRQLGGALARPEPAHGALASIDAAYAMFAVGMAATPEMKAVVDAHLDRVTATLAPWDAGRGYLNFAERRTDTRKLFAETSHRRLQRVKARYDPEDLFRSNHPIAPAR